MSAIATEAVPRTIGPYAILGELGRGGMGVVYRAVRTDGSGPEVALKMPSEEMADLFSFVRREIHALGRLRHPGVVRIFDEGVENGVPWYAMELLEAKTLEEVLGINAVRPDATAVLSGGLDGEHQATPAPEIAPTRDGVRSDLPRLLTLMYRLARVLAYIHAHGIVHRDLKPENVLVRTGDRPILVDFGLMGKFRGGSGREVLEVGGLAMGTAIYISPEQARGLLVDARADLYSFGVMLYEIVTGRPPFEGFSVNELLAMHVNQPPIAASTYVDGVPPALDRLILNLLEKKPSARLGYAEDVAEVLVEAGAHPDSDFQIESTPYLYRPEIVGRKETIDDVACRLPAVRGGQGAFLVLGGVSGIGKTSVAAAVATEATLSGFEVIAAECDPVGGQALHPLRPLLHAIADTCRGSNVMTGLILGSRLPVLRELEPALAGLGEESSIPIAPEIAKRRLLGDLAETLAAFAQARPALLIIDDLQWADEVTLRFLASLDAAFFATTPLMILGTYRADEAGPDLRALLSRPHITSLPLTRLDDASVGEIVRSMLAAPDAPPSFLDFLAAQTEGNPFFVAEYLRAAVAEHLLFRESGRWHVAVRDETYASLGLPGTIRDLVAHRLDRLSPLAQRIAEAVAVMGREASEAQLIAISGESDANALEAITELVEQHVLEPTGDGVRFAHDKLRETAYARIAIERRGLMHGRAADVLETAGDVKRHAAELARHCDLAERFEKAIDYYALAAESAVEAGACREAIELMNRAITLDAQRATAAEGSLHHARWQRVLSVAYLGLGDLPTSAEHARRSLAEAGVDLPKTTPGWRMRLAGEAIRQATHFLLPARAFRPPASRAPLVREITMAAQKFSEGQYYNDEKSVMLASGLFAVNSAERLGDAPPLIHSYANLGAVTSAVGMPRIAAHYYKRARRLAVKTNDIAGIGHIGYTSAVLYITNCDWKSCARYFDDAIAAARKTGDHQLIEMNETARGFFELYTGRLEAAEQTFTALRDRAHKRLNHQHEAWGHSWRAGTLILMNRCEEALDAIANAIKLVDALGDNAKLVSYAHRCHALLRLGRLDEALAAADVTFQAVSKIPSIIWEKYRGLSAPAEVYLEAWPREREKADILLRRLDAVSRRMPLSRPVTLRLMGMKAYLEGNPRKGERLLRKSVALATRLGLPIERATAELEIVKLTNRGQTPDR